MERFSTQELAGWGRFPTERCHVFRPEKRVSVSSILAARAQSSFISRGLGRSYGDASLNRNAGVISHLRLNRFLSFQEQEGILECEAGVSFDEILRFFLPRGFFPPVTPGTKFVTVGGAIAADVHGKNHHRDGTLSNFVLDFELLLSTGEVLICSPTAHSDIFWATVGGMGLTGVLLSARVRLKPVETAIMRVDYRRARNLDEAVAQLEESDNCHSYSVAWVDSLAAGALLGRAVVMGGNHAQRADLPSRGQDTLAPPPARRWGIPFTLPSTTLNRATIGVFNSVYYQLHRNAAGQLVSIDQFFYPLDGIGNWHRLYGRRGFVQYQFLLPFRGGREGLIRVMERVVKFRHGSFLGVLKRFAGAGRGLLSFPQPGYTLALDLPATQDLAAFLHDLDELVLSYGGRVYLAKDALLRPETFAAMYPNVEKFRALKQRLDPELILSSSLARRLRITDR